MIKLRHKYYVKLFLVQLEQGRAQSFKERLSREEELKYYRIARQIQLSCNCWDIRSRRELKFRQRRLNVHYKIAHRVRRRTLSNKILTSLRSKERLLNNLIHDVDATREEANLCSS